MLYSNTRTTPRSEHNWLVSAATDVWSIPPPPFRIPRPHVSIPIVMTSRICRWPEGVKRFTPAVRHIHVITQYTTSIPIHITHVPIFTHRTIWVGTSQTVCATRELDLVLTSTVFITSHSRSAKKTILYIDVIYKVIIKKTLNCFINLFTPNDVIVILFLTCFTWMI